MRRLLETAARLPLHAIRRVVDVGAGKGHLTAGLAALVGAPALAVDSDASLLRSARGLYPSSPSRARPSAMRRASRRSSAPETSSLGSTRAGLGEAWWPPAPRTAARTASLSRAAITSRASPRAAALARRARRRGGGAAGRRAEEASMALDGSRSVESWRTRRAALAAAAPRRERGALAGGAEMDGIQPRKAARGLEAVAAEALARRGLALPPTAAELADADAAGAADFEELRRLALLEGVLGELLELIVLFDRALALSEAGLDVFVFRAFAASASDRNLAIAAAPKAARLDEQHTNAVVRRRVGRRRRPPRPRAASSCRACAAAAAAARGGGGERGGGGRADGGVRLVIWRDDERGGGGRARNQLAQCYGK